MQKHMQTQKSCCSILIVNYHVKKELFECVKSIINSKPKTPYEIIIVDNDEEKSIQEELQKKFPKVIYIPNINNGFGQGNNTGAKYARGDYLFFLNPDTKIFSDTIDNLADFFKKYKKTGIAAPLLHDMQGKTYQQGALELTPIRGIICLSFINEIFPNNSISKKYFLKDWDKKSIKEVDVIPGTAFMIRKNIFEQINGFDEKFFLYFEEFDLCKRVKKLGYNIFIQISAKVYHAWGSSTKHRTDVQNIFKKSRYYYFKKHFGIIPAIITESILRISKYTVLLFIALLIGIYLRTYRIYETMPFIGDQAWFYLSARDMVLTGKIPLVGIESSHPWLHQGAFWTYILGLGFLSFGFNPFIGVYISIFLDIAATFFMYKLGSQLFSQRIGIIASLLYAASPIIIANAKMPYHTSPIPLLTLFYLWAICKWVKGNYEYFPITILLLALLYNFEIATFPLVIIFLFVFIFGFWKKKKWAIAILNKKIIFYSTTAYLIPMLPMLIYDFRHGFPQTFKFMTWIGYKILVFFGYPPFHPEIVPFGFINIVNLITGFVNKLIFLPNVYLAIILMVLSLGLLCKTLYYQFVRSKYYASFLLLGITFTVSLAGIIATQTTSDAYLPILFPTTIFIIAIFFGKLTQVKYIFTPFILLALIVIMNAYSVVKQETTQGFSDQLTAVKTIVSQARGRRYNLIGSGVGSSFPSFIMNYEYLTWWLGHAQSKEKEKLQFIVTENAGVITITKKEFNK